ncbi:hypothetical protein KSX_37350 [Ktedonospora formicarum]|uniref:Transcription regulator PadR N-terminal domain-containing protein n=2 Tax=Ktedonospora formicarum TaxID=2778364 RepID=A0A8J3HWV5_9CHLR|nr:hypothetical protein KSX_37350 [Ktedonospora formicarum]
MGPEGLSKRFFGRGDMKYALLELLQERPMHGYEMMKALEQKSNGMYVPSAGSIYPTLQMLEDRGLVTVTLDEGKKVYHITDEGRAFLTERQSNEDKQQGPWWERFAGRMERWDAPEVQALRSEAAEVARLFMIAARSTHADPQRFPQLHEILERTRRDLTTYIYGQDKQPGTPETGTEPKEEQG